MASTGYITTANMTDSPTPVIVSRSEHTISRKDISPEALKVLYRLKEHGFLGYLAGGGVRDLLLGRRPKDFDIVTDAHPHQVKRVFRNCRLIGRRFRLAHIMFGRTIIEVATFRSNLAAPEEPSEANDLPPPEEEGLVEEEEAETDPAAASAAGDFQVRDGLILRDNVFGTPEEDARRRDFTINALFYNIHDFSVIDYVGGLKDLDQRTIRAIGDPRLRYREDPVRMIRALRFAAVLDFTLEPEADRAIPELRDQLALSTPPRLYEEVLKLFYCGACAKALEHLWRTGLFDVLFPDAASWLNAAEGSAARDWMRRAARQMDIWKNAGHQVSPALLFALLFGPYHEDRAARLMRDGLRDGQALDQATLQHLSAAAARVKIPKHVTREAGLIMGAQPRFLRTQGKQPQRFRDRHYFESALVYLKFAAALTGRHRELVAWWQHGR